MEQSSVLQAVGSVIAGYSLQPPYTPHTLLDLITVIASYFFMPDFKYFAAAFAIYSVVRPFVKDVNTAAPITKNWFSPVLPNLKQMLLCLILLAVLSVIFLFGTDVPITNTMVPVIGSDDQGVWIEFTGMYQRCMLDKSFALATTEGCGDVSEPGRIMTVRMALNATECSIYPAIRCNYVTTFGKPVCWESIYGKFKECPSATTGRLRRPKGEHPSGHIYNVSLRYPTSSIKTVAILMDFGRSVIPGGYWLHKIVESILDVTYPFGVIIDLGLVVYSIISMLAFSLKPSEGNSHASSIKKLAPQVLLPRHSYLC